VGRVLAEPVFARLSSPAFHAAAMDGIAVRAERTFGAGEGRPRELVEGVDAFPVNTGRPLPAGCDAVIMVEHIEPLEGGRFRIEAPAVPWQHVRRQGEEIVATELLFARNHRLTPYCLGALLAGGVFHVAVRRKPRVLVIPTGAELLEWEGREPCALQAGQVLETNSYVIAELVAAHGGQCARHAVVADDPALLQRTLAEALAGESDLVLTVGGSSAGSEDFTRRAIAALGEVLVHGVTIMPGKPVVIGRIAGKPVFGMPGYAVSTIVAFEQFVAPLLAGMLGVDAPQRETISVHPARKIPSRLGMEEFVRVKLGRVGERVIATPLPRGAGAITTLTQADGMIRIPTTVEGLKEELPVTAELLRPRAALERTVVVVGSHDNTLDLLADEIRARGTGLSLSSSHVGSMGGLMALRRGVCHLAGCHLLDTLDGSYNGSYIRRMLPEVAVRRVHLAMRDQGLMVPPGNPKGITGFADLARPDVTFINRQAGSGTRILLDWRLAQLGIDPAGIRGYATEEFTHMAVAVAVLGGSADVGLGICAAARALGLDFIPVVTEQYDLVGRADFFDSPMFRALLETIRSERFTVRVAALGGYGTARSGELLE
jgi:putative molybdopterin biosynthesis protein